MSKVVDERVVSMQFDNRQFESNVRTTMSTLDKLKQSLNLSGASKGLEGVSAAASKCDLSPLGTAVDGVKVKFSAMQVMAVTALSNITNSAVNAGKRIVDSLTIAPIKTGFDEYELKMGAIQTIMASTGASLETVNKYLNELNEYSDQTIYSFQDMTTNIGKFTNAGVKLEDAVVAIKGIANEAAVSGANANEASRAMYNFSQALSTGYVQRIDWKSIELANMATVEFKEQLLNMAVSMGTVEKNAEGMYKAVGDDKWYNTSQMFIESLDEQWLTSEVLIESLKEYADETTDIGKKAKAAATEVKTFSMLMDTLKEAAQSGWAQTWELLVGDFDEAKELFTKLSDIIGGWLDKISDTRNTILGALVNISKPWETITNKMKDSGLGKFVGFADKISEIGDKVANVNKSLEEFQSIVSKVWRGDYGNSDTGRFELLDSQGWDHRVVQDLVNKGSTYKLTIEDIEASHKKFGLTMDATAESLEKVVDPMQELTDEQLRNAGLTDTEIRLYRELKAEADRLGISVDTLVQKMSRKDGRALLLESFSNAFSGIAGIFKAIGRAWVEIFPPISIIRLQSIIESINKFSKRLRMFEPEIEQLTRVFKGLFAVLDIVLTIVGGPLKIAFKILGQLLSVFDVNILDLAANIGDALVKFRDWVDSALDFTGVFEKIAPVITNVVDKIKNFFKSIKEGTSPINDVINNIRNWIASLKDAENLPEAIAQGIANGIGKIIGAIKKLFSGMKDGLSGGFDGADGIGDTVVGKIAKGIWNGLGTVGQVFVELGKIALEKLNETLVNHGMKEIPVDLISGFVNGIKNGVVTVGEAMLELGKSILSKFREILGIHSPSDETYKDGQNTVQGFADGVAGSGNVVIDAIKEFGSKILETLRNLDLGKVFAAAVTGGLTIAVVKFANAAENISKPFAEIGGVLDNVGDLVNQFKKTIKSLGKAVSFNLKMEALKSLAIAIAILVASVVALTFCEPAELWNAVAVVAALALVMALMMKAIDKMGGETKKLDIIKVAGSILMIGAAILLIAMALKKISKIDPEALDRATKVLGAIAAIMVGLMAATKLLAKSADGSVGKDIDKVGKMLMGVAVAMIIMIIAAKMIAKMEWSEMGKAAVGMLFLGGIMVGLIAATKLLARTEKGNPSASVYKVGSMLAGMAAAMLILVIAAKMIAKMEWSEMGKAAVGLLFLGGVLVGLIAATKLIEKNAKGNPAASVYKIGGMLLGMAAAMLILVLAAKMIAGMSWGEMGKAAVGIVALGGIIVGLVAATKLVGKNDLKGVGTTLLMMAAAIGILAGVAVLLGFVDPTKLAVGVLAVGALSIIMMGLVQATKYASKCVGTIVALTIAIAVLAASAAVLSFIDPTSLAVSTAAMVAMIGMLTLLVKATSKATGSIGTLMVLTLAIAVMAGAVYLLAKMTDAKDAAIAAGALGGLMLVMTGVLWALSKIGKEAGNAMAGVAVLTALVVPLLAFTLVLAALKNVKPCLESVVALVGLTGAMTGLLVGLKAITKKSGDAKKIIKGIGLLTAMVVPLLAFTLVLASLKNIKPSFESVVALVGLTGVMTLLLVALKAIGDKGAMDALKGVGLLTAMMVPLLAFVLVLSAMQGIQNAQTNAQALAGLAIALTLCLAVLAIVGKLAMGGAIAGIVALSLMAVPLLIFIAVINKMNDVQNAEININAILKLVSVLMDMLVVLAIIGPLALIGVAALTGLTTLIAGIGLLATGIGALMEKFPQLEGFIDTGIGVLINLASGLGSMVSAFATALTAGLPDVGTNLSAFMENASGFIEGIKTVDATMLEGIGTLTAAIILLTAADLINGIVTFLTGADSMAEMGTQLSTFATNAQTFFDTANSIDPNSVKAVASVADMILTLTAANVLEGITKFLGGGSSSLEKFGSQLVPFGEAMADFSAVISGKIDEGAVTAAANAGKTIADLQATLPKSGGAWQDLFGETDFDAFTAQLVPFGNAMVDFSAIVAGNIDSDAVTCAADAGKMMAELANNLPGDYGKITGLFAKEPIDLDTFGGMCVLFGRAMVQFSNTVAGNIDSDAVEGAASAGELMANLANNLPGEYGKVSALFKEQPISLDTFGGQVVTFGKAMVAFSRAVAGKIDSEAVLTAASAGGIMNELAHELPSEPGAIKALFVDSQMNFEDFGKQLVAFGKAIVEFSSVVSGNIDVDAVGSVARAARNIVDTLILVPQMGDVEAFKISVVGYGNAIASLNDIIKDIDNAAITTVSNAVVNLAEAASIMPNWVNFNTLTTGLSGFAQAMVDLSKKIKGEVDTGTIDTISKAGKAIAEMAAAIPPTTGYSSFSANIVGVGEAIVKFSEAVSGDNGLDEEAIEKVAAMGMQIGDMMSTLTGYSDVSDFVANAESLAGSIVAFSDKVDDGAVDYEAITVASLAGKAIGDMTVSFAGYQDLTDFINNAALLAQAIVDFSTKVKDSVDVDAVTNASNAGTQIGTMIGSFAEWKDMSSFIDNSDKLADAIVDFSATVDEGAVDVASVGNATTSGHKIADMLSTLNTTYNVDSAVTAMQTLGPAVVEFAETVSEIDLMTTTSALRNFSNLAEGFGEAGSESVDSFVQALVSAKTKVADSISAFAKGATSNIKAHYGNNSTGFYGAGKWLVQGFANGISANTYIATAKSSAMASAALKAAKEALGINSPSKEFIKVGKGIPEGFAMGIDKLGSLVDKSVVSMANGALKGTKDVISRIAGYVDSDIDSQPTIRPVLDLSGVSSGVNQIGNMFNMTPSLGVLANVGSISSMMNNRQLSSGSDDIVSAIKDLGKFGGDTYQINGISYDENSDVADAIRTLTRAARMERRI